MRVHDGVVGAGDAHPIIMWLMWFKTTGPWVISDLRSYCCVIMSKI